MIGRFASKLGERLPGQMVAGVILVLLGAWFSLQPIRHDYPHIDDLVAVKADVLQAVEIRKRRGALVRFLIPDPLELQATLGGDGRLVRYSSNLPRYAELKETLKAGTHVFHLWADAPDPDDATFLWQFDSAGSTLLSLEETTGALRQARTQEIWLPAAIMVFGLAIVGLTLWRRRRAHP